MATKEVPVRAQINALPLGGSADFPLERYDYVVSCRSRLQTTTLKRFSSKINKERGVVTLTRDEDIVPAEADS